MLCVTWATWSSLFPNIPSSIGELKLGPPSSGVISTMIPGKLDTASCAFLIISVPVNSPVVIPTSRKPLDIVSPPELNHCEPVVRYKFSMPRTSDKEDSTLSIISLDSSAEKFPRALIFISAAKGSTSAK